MVDADGDTTLVPEALTMPIYGSMLTVSAPTTFQYRVDEPFELRLLLNSAITGGVRSADGDTGLTVVTTDLVTVLALLLAVIV